MRSIPKPIITTRPEFQEPSGLLDSESNPIEVTGFSTLVATGKLNGVIYFPKDDMHCVLTVGKRKMKKIYIGVAWPLLSLSCSATDSPAIGLLEQVPVIGKGYKVTARPIYIFTNKKLTEPTIFKGMVGTENPYLSMCCYQVKDISPLELEKEIAKYSQDDEFGKHLNGIRGHKYIYAAQPLSDKSKWTPLMSTIMQKSADLEDGSPFSAPVIAATHATNQVPVTISTGRVQTVLLTRYDEKSDRMIFIFQQGKDKIEFSEPTFAD